MRYKWLLFDADGTLFDYDKAESSALARSFEQANLAFEPRYVGIYRQINGQMWREFEQGTLSQQRLRTRRFEQLFKAVGVEADAKLFGQSYLNHLSDGTDLIDGAETVVKALYGRFGLLIITNGIAEVQRPRLAKSALAEYFPDLVISEEVGSAKPASLIFDVAFAKMGYPDKNQVLIVGDSLTSDIQGGHDYGIDVCWFNPERRPRPLSVEIQCEIQSLSQLLSIVQKS